MSKKMVAVGLGLVFLAIAGIAIAGAFSDAERAADKFDDEVDDLKKMSVDETKKIVEAICEAEEAERKSVGKDISARVKSKIKGEYEDLEDLMEDAKRTRTRSSTRSSMTIRSRAWLPRRCATALRSVQCHRMMGLSRMQRDMNGRARRYAISKMRAD